MYLNDEQDLSHSQVVTRSVPSSLNEIDAFGKAIQSTIFRVDNTEFGKSTVPLKFSQWVNHKSNSKLKQ